MQHGLEAQTRMPGTHDAGRRRGRGPRSSRVVLHALPGVPSITQDELRGAQPARSCSVSEKRARRPGLGLGRKDAARIEGAEIDGQVHWSGGNALKGGSGACCLGGGAGCGTVRRAAARSHELVRQRADRRSQREMAAQGYSRGGRGAGATPRRAVGCAIWGSSVVPRGGGDPRGAHCSPAPPAPRLQLAGAGRRRWYRRPASSAGR